MQRTYGRRARRRSPLHVQTDNHGSSYTPKADLSQDQSHTPRPRKRQKVFVEIVSPSPLTPKAKKPELTQFPDQSTQFSSSASHTRQKQSPILRRAETHTEPMSCSTPGINTPINTPTDLSPLFGTPSPSRSPGHLAGGSIVKRMLSRSRTEPSIEGAVTRITLSS
ncbi:hypothetical protein BS17DRAFT_738723 [Gyrodon lividus]|nr:hypothetical protein BS17DRAFT_738723 [Gyrodon lividus]